MMAPMPIVQEKNALLDYLISRFPQYKKTKLKQLLKYGSVTVNSVITKAFDHALSPGDRVDFLDRRSSVRAQLKSKLNFPVIYEDEWLIVVDKPEGLLTMATEQEKIRTLYHEVTAYVRSQDKEGKTRVFIVHRLDREASGLVVFAKKENIKRALQDHWKDSVKKYYAVVEGIPKQRSGLIESYLLEDKFRRVYSTDKRSRDAKHAATRYRVLRSKNHHSLLDITLLTGRKNQIRVHLSENGHPILGDDKYGHPSPGQRLFLHAYFLSFSHPQTGEPMTFQTEPPKEFLQVV